MFSTGLVEEVRGLLAGGATGEEKPFESLGYKQAAMLLRGDSSLGDAIASTQQGHRNYAKRQTTWFRHQLPDDKKSDGTHVRHAQFGELSERNLAEIIPFILSTG